MSYRRMLFPAVVIVVVAAITIPVVTLQRQWAAASALKARGNFVFMQPPPFVTLSEQEWYADLFGMADQVTALATLSAEDARHCCRLRGLSSLSFERCDDAAWPELPLDLVTLRAGLKKGEINPAALKQIARMHRLEGLFLSAPWLASQERHVTAALPGALTRLQHLRRLGFQNVHVPTDVLQTLLGQFPHLEHLQLSGAQLTDADVELVSRHTGIRSLDLSRSRKTPPLTAASLEHLVAMKSLRELTVDKPSLDPTVPKPVFSAENLASLSKRRPDIQVAVFDPLDVPFRSGSFPPPEDE